MAGFEEVQGLIDREEYTTVLAILRDGEYPYDSIDSYLGDKPLINLCSRSEPLNGQQIALISEMIMTMPPEFSESLKNAMKLIIKNKNYSLESKKKLIDCYKAAVKTFGDVAFNMSELARSAGTEIDMACLQYILDEIPVMSPEPGSVRPSTHILFSLTLLAMKQGKFDLAKILLTHPLTDQAKITLDQLDSFFDLAISGESFEIVKLLVSRCLSELDEEDKSQALFIAIGHCLAHDNVGAFTIVSQKFDYMAAVRAMVPGYTLASMLLDQPCPELCEHFFGSALKPNEEFNFFNSSSGEQKAYRSFLSAALVEYSYCDEKTEQLLKNLLIKHSSDVTIEELEVGRDCLGSLPILNPDNFVRSPLNPEYLVHKDCTLVARFEVLKVTQAAWAKGAGHPVKPEPTGDVATDRQNALAFTLGLRRFCREVGGTTVEPLAREIIGFSGGSEV